MTMPQSADACHPIATRKRVQTLPFHHRDPFDRMLIAQAIEEGLTIVTPDRIFAAYGVPVADGLRSVLLLPQPLERLLAQLR